MAFKDLLKDLLDVCLYVQMYGEYTWISRVIYCSNDENDFLLGMRTKK